MKYLPLLITLIVGGVISVVSGLIITKARAPFWVALALGAVTGLICYQFLMGISWFLYK